MIQVKNINKTFDNGVVGLKNISCTFYDKSFNLIMGHSGSGKTTLLQVASLMLKPSSGSIIIDDIEAISLKPYKQTIFRRDNIGFVFQSYLLHPQLSALDNILLALYANENITDTQAKDKAFELLDQVGLSDRASHKPKELSGGEQQRVAIARALANNPKYIFADEPTGNLDEENEKKILEILMELKKEHCIVMVSHNIIAEKYADRIFDMSQGEVTERT